VSSRLRILLILFAAGFVAASLRLFFIQVVGNARYEAEAEGQQVIEEAVEPRRGSIYLSLIGEEEVRHVPVALTKRWWHIWAAPDEILEERKEHVTREISELLEIDSSMVRERLSKKGDPYEPLKDKVDDETLKRIEERELEGIHAEPVDDRYYPLHTLASHLTGFLGRTEDARVGQYGLEEAFEEELAGTTGKVEGFRTPFGRIIWPFSNLEEPRDGSDVYLTVDYHIQLLLEKKLAEARERYSASSVSAVVMRPSTGQILALAVSPSYDPNEYHKEDVSVFFNPVVQGRFEPGSIFKPITMAAALDTHVISPDLTYVDGGPITVADRVIRNSTGEEHGVQTMTQVLEKSLNTGVVFAVGRIPRGKWFEYVERFGFSEKTGIELPGELAGDVRNLAQGGPVERATSAFGQGIAVTPLELVSAIGAIANDGTLMQPYLVSKVLDSDGKTTRFARSAEKKREVVSPETAKAVTEMMVSVVENGGGRRAQIPGYFVAGKTGTAQIPSPSGGYSEETIHSFVGFAPAFEPEFVMLIKIDRPQGVQFSEASAAPIFKEVGEFILHYLGVEPDKPLEE
jgi:cell division protein FtsI/penicillin-binding protein 2